jgi:Fe2+ transport system protein FeoA
LATKDQRKLQKLMAFGILPGMPVKVLQTRPSIVFQVGQTQLAVDEGIAGDILVGKE